MQRFNWIAYPCILVELFSSTLLLRSSQNLCCTFTKTSGISRMTALLYWPKIAQNCRSTAIEVALKMAFRKFWKDHPELDLHGNAERPPVELKVVGIDGGYHGDTLGAMDAVSPSPYNGPAQYPWQVTWKFWNEFLKIVFNMNHLLFVEFSITYPYFIQINHPNFKFEN